MKNTYDYASEMVKIAEASGQNVFGIEKVAFSRDGQNKPSEVEDEMKKMSETKFETESKSCDCVCHDGGEDCHCSCTETKKEASDVSLEDTAGLLLEISDELEGQGHERLAAATIILADTILKTAAKKKGPKKTKSKGKKKMTMKERMKKMRGLKKKGPGAKKEVSSTPETTSPESPSSSPESSASTENK